jgi:phthiocerol/phenolphthiocerol synthesis type-I polyketide synthase C
MDSADFRRERNGPVAVVGMSCRLPGAPDVQAFWDLLNRGACSVTAIGNDRWHRERFWHPRASEAGFSYSFAAGVLDDPFMFDSAAFGISPREAEQMDPQQRLLLELVWEALEDAGIPPSQLKGTEAGVFVGASSLDYGGRQMADPASIDAHFMAGNTLSVIANRFSYVFGLNGPSFTVDTACSSSLVALNQALLALDRGTIDTAIVAGVNVIASPFSFIGFSRAGMLSPTGLCRPFAANADGYVRAEGGVVLVLRTLHAARANAEQPRAMIIASAVNSDGRTSGLTLPSADAQGSLLERLYRQHAIDPDKLAFVEAHGTGTRVGDPAEAHAIGRALGQRRTRPLPIGSVKSNIGHLEPASGLAGLLKAALSLQHKRLPASLHLAEPNPDIPFGELNLAPAHAAISLSGPLHAGVSSFGFGGTNAHVVLRAPTAQERAGARRSRPALRNCW